MASNCPPAGYPQPPKQGCGCGGQPTPPSMPTPTPTPMTVPYQPGMSGLLGLAQGIAGAAIEQLAGELQTRKLCGDWKTTDGLTEHKLCCTPSVGRAGGGVKAALCIKVSRPIDPWGSPTPG